jgi:hypothetical protein
MEIRDKRDPAANEAGVSDSGVLRHAKLVKVKGGALPRPRGGKRITIDTGDGFAPLSTLSPITVDTTYHQRQKSAFS